MKSAARQNGAPPTDTPSTSTRPALKSGAAWLASAPPETAEAFLEGLSEQAILALPYIFEFWALDHQLPPAGDWKSWVILGGRGAGKTRAGAEWVRAQVEGARPLDVGAARRVALVGETLDQVREVMVFGESGILACAPPDRRPQWEATRRRLVWPNGAIAQAFSAHEPESLRGPQFDAAWVDEIGCPAVDKGTNQPNVFVDPKSSESALPRFSDGRRDDLIQLQYLRALFAHWGDPAQNPVSSVYGAPMVDMSRAHVWAWDARPWPAFPNARALWSDGENYARGHWVSGRIASETLDDVVAEICERSGMADHDTARLHGIVRGYALAETDTARAALQPLMLAHGFDAVERDGAIRFANRDAVADAALDPARLAVADDLPGGVETARLPEAETAGRVRLSYIEADDAYAARAAEAVFPGEESHSVAGTELALALTGAEARGIVERWLAEARVARDRLRFALPPSDAALGAGDVVRHGAGPAAALYRIDRVEDTGARHCEAVRVEPSLFRPSDSVEEVPAVRPFSVAAPVFPLFLDLPLLTGTEIPHAPHLAVTATPWPGSVAVYDAPEDAGYSLNRLIERGATLGVTESPLHRADPSVWDRGAALRLRVYGGALSSAGRTQVLNGANAAAIGAGSGGDWEVFQFVEARLVGDGLYELSLRLRGQLGTDAVMPAEWPPGSYVVLLDGAPAQIELAPAARDLARHFRIGPARRGYDDPVYHHEQRAFRGNGLRPYAPVHLRAAPAGDGALDISWIRRSRIDGDSWASTEVPLGETREAYLLRIIRDGTILREAETAAPGWHYAAATRAADGPAPVTLEVAQISDRFGPGPFARMVIDE